MKAVFVLRYHPAFASAFKRALATVPYPNTDLSIMPAWSNALPSSAGILESLNRKLCHRVYGVAGAACVNHINVSNVAWHKFNFESLVSEARR